MPLMAVCAVVVLIRVLTLGTPDPSLPDQNVMNGLAYMWNPDFTALGNPQTWLAAAGQIFFSIFGRLRHHHQLRLVCAAKG